MAARASVLVSGGTGSGKTTTLNALSGAIPGEERIVTIEDAAELRLRQRHVVRLEARPPNLEGRGEVTIRQLVRNALRMRPDRIVVGEVRGAEALDMLQALNTGHDGSLTTVHANSPADALRRVETLALMAGVGLPHAAVREQVASALDLVVHQARLPGGARAVESVTEVVRVAGGAGVRELYRRGGELRPPGRTAALAARRGRRCGAERGRERPVSAAALLALVSGVAGSDRGSRPRREAAWSRAAREPRVASPRWWTRWCALGREGRDPGAVERRRLLLAGAGVAFALGAFLAGPAAGLALAAGGPWAVARVLRARRERYRRAVDAEVPGMALAVADALARRALAARRPERGHARGGRRRRARAAPRRRRAGRRGAHRAGARGDARPRALAAARHRRGRLPAAAPRGRRPRPPAARLRAGDGGELAARGRAARGHRPGPLHRAAGGAAARSAAPCWPSWRARAGSPACWARS